MFFNLKNVSSLATIIFLMSLNSGCGNSNGGNGSGNGNGQHLSVDENGTTVINGIDIIASIPIDNNLSDSEIKSLLFVREEEKLARDVYLTLDKIWGDSIKTFANISNAEQTHTDSVKALLTRYNLTDPVTETEDQNLGIFQDLDLQELYDSLIAKGEKSLVDALQVGEQLKIMTFLTSKNI